MDDGVVSQWFINGVGHMLRFLRLIIIVEHI